MQVGLVNEPFLGSNGSSLYSYFHTISLSTRELEGGYYEVNCTLRISAELLKQSIPYKYVIHTPKTKRNRDDCYEYLHEHHSMNPNRLLRIPKYQQEYGRKFVHCTIKILFSYYYPILANVNLKAAQFENIEVNTKVHGTVS